MQSQARALARAFSRMRPPRAAPVHLPVPTPAAGCRWPGPTGPRQAGFTLIEISLVILIIAIVLSIALPRFRDPSDQDLTSHVRRLATTFRLVRDEAIISGRVYRLNYDLNARRYWIAPEGDRRVTGGATSESSFLMRPVSLPDTVAFSDIVLQSTGKLIDGQVYTRFFPDGFVDPTVIHMDNGQRAYTLSVWPLTGRVSIYEGYRDLEIVG